jgi:hypothetical protein
LERTVTEPITDLIDRLFELPRRIEQGRRIGGAGVDERLGSNPDQSESHKASGFRGEQAGNGMIQRVGQLRRVNRPFSTLM